MLKTALAENDRFQILLLKSNVFVNRSGSKKQDRSAIKLSIISLLSTRKIVEKEWIGVANAKPRCVNNASAKIIDVNAIYYTEPHSVHRFVRRSVFEKITSLNQPSIISLSSIGIDDGSMDLISVRPVKAFEHKSRAYIMKMHRIRV